MFMYCNVPFCLVPIESDALCEEALASEAGEKKEDTKTKKHRKRDKRTSQAHRTWGSICMRFFSYGIVLTIAACFRVSWV